MNPQKAVTTIAQNVRDEVIIRRRSEPNEKVKKIFDVLKFKYAPFKKKKSVVHKSEFENCQCIEQSKVCIQIRVQCGLIFNI